MAATLLAEEALPVEAAQHLRLAALSYHQDDVAEGHLHAALTIAPDHAAALIGLYRFYFYKNRLEEALAVSLICLDKAARLNGLAAEWHKVSAGDADFGNYGAKLPRFYLFTLKAYAYLRLRLGNTEEGSAAVAKLLELDPTDKIGARVLLEVIERMGHSDDE